MGTTLKIFLNGKLDSTHVVPAGVFSENYNQLDLFERNGSYYDEFAVYERALTDDEVQYIYYKGVNDQVLDTLEPNPVYAPIPDEYFTIW